VNIMYFKCSCFCFYQANMDLFQRTFFFNPVDNGTGTNLQYSRSITYPATIRRHFNHFIFNIR
jgi:hypothetical protein